MNRRAFFTRSAILAAGVVAADQLELLERLGGWTRRFFPGFGPGRPQEWMVAGFSDLPMIVKKAEWDRLLRDVYRQRLVIHGTLSISPLTRRLMRPKPYAL